MDMNAIYAGCTDAAEKQRLGSLEIFDEFADWMLSNAHYAIFLVTNSRLTSNGAPHWTAAFCSGHQTLPRMEATAATLRALPSSPLDEGIGAVAIIRTFEKQDLAAVQELFETTHLAYKSKAVRKFVANRLKQGDMRDVYRSFMLPTARTASRASCFWVAEVDKKIVGCIGVKPVESSHSSDCATAAELCRLSVDASARRLGVASALVAVLESFALASGYAQISLETIGAMESAQKLYRALGYDEVSQEDFQSFSLVRFRKELHQTASNANK